MEIKSHSQNCNRLNLHFRMNLRTYSNKITLLLNNVFGNFINNIFCIYANF
jgi:hypothetical protein